MDSRLNFEQGIGILSLFPLLEMNRGLKVILRQDLVCFEKPLAGVKYFSAHLPAWKKVRRCI